MPYHVFGDIALPVEMPVQKMLFEFDAPLPFRKTAVKFITEGRDKILNMEIETLGRTIVVPENSYQSMFDVIYEIRLTYNLEDREDTGNIKAFQFTLEYGTSQKVQCGFGEIDVKRAVEFIINSNAELITRDHNDNFELCQAFTAKENEYLIKE